jgi:hypothetical protein
MIIDDVVEINRRLFYDLWNISDVNHPPSGLSSRLILPKRRSEDIRISEQESRFLYCSLLNTLNYYYSVETPTEDVYSQKGETPRSAASDLSLYVYKKNKFKKVVNVEFKAHNPSKEHIKKDIEKLLREEIHGNWFHTLKNVDSRTLPVLFDKIADSLKACRELVTNRQTSIVFSFCVLDKKWACLNRFTCYSYIENFDKYVNEFFEFEYTIKDKRVEVPKKGDWQIFSQKNSSAS